MTIQPIRAYTATSLLAGATQQRQTSANAAAIPAAAAANSADKVVISQAARERFAAQSAPAATALNGTNGATATYDTSQGTKDLDIDAYFTPGTNTSGSLSTLPPLLLPSQKNVDALTSHISAVMPQFLAQNKIPSAPSSITYDDHGEIQLPADYPYAAQFKQALADNPAMARELSTVNALASHVAEMKKLVPFQQEYAAATSKAAAEAVVAKYSYLFSGNHHYDTIALQFSENGSLSVTADGKPLA